MPLQANDPALPTLRTWWQTTAARYAKDGKIRPYFGAWQELPYGKLQRLFPGRRFFKASWIETPILDKTQTSGIASGVKYTLVCDIAGNLVAENSGDRNSEAFGDMLAASKIRIRSPADAKLVWDAFCDLDQKAWKELPVLRVSETVWHLGDATTNGIHYYYEVRLNDDTSVKAARLRADKVEISKPE